MPASLVTASLLPSRRTICAAASSARGGVGSCLRRPSWSPTSARRAGVRCNSTTPTPPGFPGQTPPEMPATNRPPVELPSIDTPPEMPGTNRPPEELPSIDTPPEFEAPPGVDVPMPGAPTPGPEQPGPSIPSPSTPEVPTVPPNPDVPPPKPPEVNPPGAPPEVVPPEPPGAAPAPPSFGLWCSLG